MELLKKLYRISSPSGEEQTMSEFVISCLREIGAEYHTDESGNIYAIKGSADTYPCIVSHLDEVHDFRSPSYRVLTFDRIMFGYDVDDKETVGIGADDKNGIWICLRAMIHFDTPIKCAFFVGEETGCIGSYRADMTFFDDVRYVIQCDRRGGHDFISNAAGVPLCSREFLAAVDMAQFDYYIAHGSVTDVMALKQNGLSVSACNLSCGYYNPHTGSEATSIDDLLRCLQFVRHIVTSCVDVYPHTYVPEPEHDWSISRYDGDNTSQVKTLFDDTFFSDNGTSATYDDQYCDAFAEMESIYLKDGSLDIDSFTKEFAGRFPLLAPSDYGSILDEIISYHGEE